MRGVVVGMALALSLAGCGADTGGGTPPIGNEPPGGGVQEPIPPPPPPPGPVHQGPGDVTIPLDEAEQLTVGGVEFSIVRTSETSGIVIAKNLNSNDVKLVVDRVNGSGGIVLDESFLDSGETVNSQDVDLSPGVSYRFSVKVWKGGIDFVTCSFSAPTCYSSSEKKTFTFYIE